VNLFYSSACLNYEQPRHPESPERVRAAADLLRARGYSFMDAEPCSHEKILRVHERGMFESVLNGTHADADTPVLPGIFDIALLSAGAAIQACRSASLGVNSFSLMRPPGHHATPRRVMGFCYFNNMAVAVFDHGMRHPGARVAILDIDCHHGNGTEEIFWGNPDVLFVSLHQSPCYPGTGLASRDNCLNYPLPPGTAEKEYLETLESACGRIKAFDPVLVGISAGFDTHKNDPLTRFGLETATYGQISKSILGLGKPVFALLEGGYGKELPECVLNFIKGMETA
jgi:acetoin utilization deacetylase AcuC-like enzyme